MGLNKMYVFGAVVIFRKNSIFFDILIYSQPLFPGLLYREDQQGQKDSTAQG